MKTDGGIDLWNDTGGMSWTVYVTLGGARGDSLKTQNNALAGGNFWGGVTGLPWGFNVRVLWR